jgi:superfamily II DNA or RNA helicase
LEFNLYPFQAEAIETLWSGIKTKERQLCVLPTASGKGLILDHILRRTSELGLRSVLLLNRETLIDQFIKRLSHLSPSVFSAAHGMRQRSGLVTVASIQSVHRHELGDIRLSIFDEAHNISPTYENFFSQHPRSKIIGFTATPYKDINYIYGKDQFFPRVDFTRSMAYMISEGHIVPPIAKAPPCAFDVSGVKIRGGEYVIEELERLVDDEKKIKEQVEDALPRLQQRKKIVWTCTSIKHSEMVADRISKTERVVVLHSKLDNDTKKTALREFEDGNIRHMVTVMMVSEGYDYKQIDSIVLMRPTRSARLYCLDSETEILTSNGWAKMGAVKIGDVVPSMDMRDCSGKWSRVLNVIRRPLEKDEFFITYKAPRANFRVTNNHDLIFKTKKNISWRKEPAQVAASLKDGIYMPTAVEISQPGVPLKDCEIYFIGMMMTDGTWSNFQADISQSARHEGVLERIEKCLAECEMSYRKSVVKVENNSGFVQRYTRYRYSISAGKPRLGCVGKTVDGKTGFRHLLPYMDKDFAAPLMSLSKSQFLILIQAMWDGDGFKKLNVDYTPRSWTICSARKHAVDRIQALCAIHGFTGHLREEIKGRSNPLYILTISPQRWRSVGGVGDRPKIKIEPPSKKEEHVWCVETEHGTIITRRHGKVTVMGNCQVVGRGLRKCEGKINCLVLDYGQVIASLGPVSDPVVGGVPRKKSSDEKTVETVKLCPKCYSVSPLGSDYCTECEFEFPKPKPIQKLDNEAADADILANKPTSRTFTASMISFSQYTSKAGNRCVLVVYGSSFNQMREYFPSQFGFARLKIRMKLLTGFDFSSFDECYNSCHDLIVESGNYEVTYKPDGNWTKITQVKRVNAGNTDFDLSF